MIRSPSFLIIAFLIVAQLIGPLVHAHTGGARSPGVLHVPGLEGLALQTDGTQAQLPSGDGGHDVVVGVAPGLEVHDDALSPPHQPTLFALVDPAVLIQAIRVLVAAGPPQSAPFSPPDRPFPAASPRAPPA